MYIPEHWFCLLSRAVSQAECVYISNKKTLWCAESLSAQIKSCMKKNHSYLHISKVKVFIKLPVLTFLQLPRCRSKNTMSIHIEIHTAILLFNFSWFLETTLCVLSLLAQQWTWCHRNICNLFCSFCIVLYRVTPTEWLVSDSIYWTLRMCKWDHIQGGGWIFAYCDRWMSAVQKSAMLPVSSLNASVVLRPKSSHWK